MNIITDNWSIIIYILGLIGVYLADHYKIKALEEKVVIINECYNKLSEQVQEVNQNICKLQTIIEERFRDGR